MIAVDTTDSAKYVITLASDAESTGSMSSGTATVAIHGIVARH